MRAIECWYKPGGKKRNRAERKALKAAVELSQAESGEDAVSEVEESDDNYLPVEKFCSECGAESVPA